MAVVQNYLPGDSLLIDKIVCELKSQGIFDEFRKECIADVDTKPAYQNLRQRVEGSVSGFLNKQTWNPDVNKNHVRELLRKNIYESGFLEIGVERIVDQVVNPKINSVFLPKVTEVVYKFLGIERPNSDKCKPEETKVKKALNANSLLPTDLEAVSPESETPEKKHDKSNDSQNLDDSKIDEDESPPFEPIEEQTAYLPNEENSVDSHLSGFSGLLSHDSNQSQDINKPMQVETSNQDSIISKHSSDGHLSIAMSDDADMKMEFCDDSHQSKSSKTNDSNSKAFDFNLENSSRSSSSKAERKAEDKSKSDKSKSYDKHKSKSDGKSKDRKDERDRKSDHDKKDGKEKHSSKSRDKSKDYKSSRKVDKERKTKDGKSDKDRDSKTDKNEKEKSKSCNGSHHRSSSSSSSSKDKSRKESTSKESGSSSNKDKSKTSTSSRGGGQHKDSSKSKDDKDKSHSAKHDSKTDKSKKDDKHDRHHSRSERHSSSSSKSKDKDKKEPKKEKKENKDDHFSSKKRSDRRSTDRDSNDGQSGLKSSSSSFDSYFSSSQTQSKNQESSNSNSNTGSGDSGASDAVESEIVNLKTPITFVNDDIESVGEVYINAMPRIKLIKPKFASNIHEARRLMKIRRQLSKIEQQNVLQFSSKTLLNNKETYLVKTEIAKEKSVVIRNNNWKNEDENENENENEKDHRKPNILKKEGSTKKHNAILDAPPPPLQIEIIPNRSGSVTADEEISQVSPPLKSSVVSAASWDALEAKFNQNIDYSTYYDDPDTPEKTNESIINVNTNPNDCFYFNEDDILPVTERYILFVMTLIEKLEKEIASSRQEEEEETTKSKSNQNNIDEHASPEPDRGNGLNKSVARKTFKRKLMEYSDAKNNNKKFNNHHIEVHESFSLPLSPAESDISVDKKFDIVESERPPKKNEVELSVKFKKNNITSASKRQRYSSEDLYKPRPFFSGSRRRARNNLELD